MRYLIYILFYLICFAGAGNTAPVWQSTHPDVINVESVGSSITGRAVTATLFVSGIGNDTDGSSWTNAFTTIQGALDVASTNVNECTCLA